MSNSNATLPAIYAGWLNYQNLVVAALRPLTAEQLALRTAPNLRSIGDIVRHMIGARGRWFYRLMGEGGEPFADFSTWDRPGRPERSALELVDALQATWEGMQAAIGRWTPEQWQQTWPDDEPGAPEITRHWVIWHLIEHDVHHGGEISLTLGMHGLAAPDV
jgi:uncharacterized damage-inducible protein DinB